MFKLTNLKLYRKFLILAILIGSCLALSSNERVAAGSPCCDACLAAYDACVYDCNRGVIPPFQVPACLQACDNNYTACTVPCAPPVCILF